MNEEGLKEKVKEAVRLFIDNDKKLLDLKVYELAASHRIAVYLEKQFSNNNLNFDCEYNKYFNLPKKAPNGKEIRPDILVHKRNVSSGNVLVIEIKKNRKNKWDDKKLEMLTNQDGQYKYKLGVFIYFPSCEAKYKWFVDGRGSDFE